jgi:O-antigen/teichoic acid export membrane protein
MRCRLLPIGAHDSERSCGTVAGLRRQGGLDTDTATAAGLAGAQLAANGIAVVFTVVLARLLGREDYGALAALISTFLIVSVPGYALQVAAARAAATGRIGLVHGLRGTVDRWTRRVALATAGLAVAGVLLREPLARLIGVEDAWAAAAVLPTGGLWLLLSIQRGTLAGLGAYRPVGASIVGEAVGRLAVSAGLVGAGLGTTGAYFGTPLAFAVTALALGVVLARRTGDAAAPGTAWPLRSLTRDAVVPIAALVLIASLQNVDVIIVRHQVADGPAGAYAAASVAAKVVVWTAVGVGLYLLPEAARRTAAGVAGRPVLLRALAVVGAVAAPALVVFALAPETVLRLGFGAEYVDGARALPLLALAMTLLGSGYLAVQFLLAIASSRFLLPLAAVTVAEPALLLIWDVESVAVFAALVLAAQLAAAVSVLLPSLRASTPATVRAHA